MKAAKLLSSILFLLILSGIFNKISSQPVPPLINAGENQYLVNETSTFMLGYICGSYSENHWTLISGSGTIVDPTVIDTEVTDLALGENIFKLSAAYWFGILSDSVSIFVYENSTFAGPDQEINTDYTTLNAYDPAPGTGEWTVIEGQAIIENPTLYNSAVLNLINNSNILRWTVTINENTYYDDLIIINNTKDADAGPDQEICTDFTTLEAADPFPETGIWTVMSGAATFDDISLHNTVARNIPPGITILKWTVGVSFDDVTITNNSVIADAGPDQGICTDHTTLAGNDPSLQGATGYWTTLSPTIILNSSLYNSGVSGLEIGYNTFQWTVLTGECSDSDEVIIFNGSVTADAGPDQEICTDHTTLAANDPSLQGATGIWTMIAGSGTIVNPTLYNSDMINIHSFITFARWTVMSENSSFVKLFCEDNDDVLIINNSVTADAGPDQEICTDHTIMAALDPSLQGATGIWTVVGGNGVITDPTLYNSEISDLNVGSNTLHWEVTSEECSDVDELIIFYDSITADAGEDVQICENFYTFQGNIPPQNSTGLWQIIAGSGNIINPTRFNSLVTDICPGVNVFVWIIASENCSDNDVIVIESNMVTAYAGEDTLINVNNYQLQADPVNPWGDYGYWTILEGNGVFNDISSENAIVTELDYGDNIFHWNVSFGFCSVYDDVIITRTVNAGEDITVEGDTVYLDAVLPDGAIGEWTIMYGTGTFEDDTDPKTRVWDLNPGINILRWTVTFPDKSIVLWDELTITKTVGIDDLLSKSLIYPNPSNGIINIISGKSLEKADIKIYNISGSLVKFKILNKSANELKISLSQNKPGMYFIKIKTQNSIITEKLIIEQIK